MAMQAFAGDPNDDPNKKLPAPAGGPMGNIQNAMTGGAPPAMPDSPMGGGDTMGNIRNAMTGGGTPMPSPDAPMPMSQTPAAPPPTGGPTPAPPPQTGGPTPAANAPDQQGIGQFQSWARGQFGREATPQELQQIAQNIGYTGGALTPEMMQAAQGQATSMAAAMGGTTATPAAQTTNDLLETRIRQMLGSDPTQLDPNRPDLNVQRNAFARGQGNALERAKMAAAERSGGAQTGGLEAQMQGIDLAGAQAGGDFEAGLMQRELQTQRDQTMQAMQMAQQAGLTREAQQLQERLATQDLALRRTLGMGQLGLGAASLNQQGQQFNASLGHRYWSDLQNMERDELTALLGAM